MSTERILVTGSREWPGTWEDMAVHFPEDGDVTIIHGACSRIRRGVQVSADMLADFIARGLGFAVEAYPVDHRIDGPWPGAGPLRNARMLAKSKPDRGLAFGALWKIGTGYAAMRSGYWKHTGTGGMVSLMLDARLPVRWIAAPDAPAVDLVKMPEAPR